MLTHYDQHVFARLDPFLPQRIVDVHTHCWLNPNEENPIIDSPRAPSWPVRVAPQNSVGELMETYAQTLPGRTVVPLIFPNIAAPAKVAAANDYLAATCPPYDIPALCLATPDTPVAEVERRLAQPPFVGVKVYLTYAPPEVPREEITIFDFLPPALLDLLNQKQAMVMLHVPRDLRLKDPVNLEQLIEIDRNYSRVKTIVAHVGRAYCAEDLGSAFEELEHTENLLFDTSANTNTEVFAVLLNKIGPQRVLFGSDLPITKMRMHRVCEDGRYVNLVAAGAYGDLSDDSHMREVDGPQAERITLFLYEELLALKEAAQAVGLGRDDIESIFSGNAERVIPARPGS